MNRFNQIFSALLLSTLIGRAQPAVTLTSVISFQNSGTNANRPLGGLLEGSDGNLYGTTWQGGDYGWGTVFKLTLQGQFTVIHSFTGNDGGGPEAPVVQGNDGALYGVAPNGQEPGPAFWGTIFRVGLDGSFTNLFFFPSPVDYPSNSYGYDPNGLILGSDGNFYGTTALSYMHYASIPFQVTPSGLVTPLWTGTPLGPIPPGALTQGSDGKLYGVIPGPGAVTATGLIYSMPCTAGTPNILGSFDSSGGTNGVEPSCIIQGADGNFYGTAHYGGPWPHTEPHYWGNGTVFKMTPDGVISLLHAFNGNDGFYPYGLMQGTDGNLYGTATGGGTNGGGGTLFQISPSGQFRLLYSFSSSDLTHGWQPRCVLLQARDGNFYGTTSRTGTGVGGGAVFRLSVPLADSPSIQGMSVTNGVITFSWLALKGRSYQVQYTGDLTSTTWSNLGNPTLATNHLANVSDPIGPGTQRYYRVALLP